jgi:tetratricopeptide (TPR) repeat protein
MGQLQTDQFMTIFIGLQLYEIVMLVCGCIVFVLGLVVAIVAVVRKESLWKTLPPFAIAIIMIGFPAYTKIQIREDGIDLETKTGALLNDPENGAKREEVSKDVAKFAKRPLTDPQTLSIVAKAQIALGENTAAQENVTKALTASPQDAKALGLQKRLELDRNLEQWTATVEKNPGDATAKSNLNQVINEAGKLQIASPVTTLNLAKAHAALGNTDQAKANMSKAVRINPNLGRAIALPQKPN